MRMRAAPTLLLGSADYEDTFALVAFTFTAIIRAFLAFWPFIIALSEMLSRKSRGL